MKLSVVCTALNSEKTIGDTIESFLRQSHPEKEFLLIDGASADRTVAIAESFRSPLIRIVSEKDSGIYSAMNKGLALFQGDAVGFLGSDDIFHSEQALALLADGLADADVVYGDLQGVRDHAEKRVIRVYRPGPFHSRSFQLGFMPPHTTFYVRRHVIEKVGPFDTRYRIGADYDFIFRIMALNHYRVHYVPELLVDFKLGGVSSRGLGSVLRQNLECLDSRRRHQHGWPIDAAFFLKWARSFLQLRWR